MQSEMTAISHPGEEINVCVLFHFVNIVHLHNLFIVEEEPRRFTSRGMLLANERHIVS